MKPKIDCTPVAL